MGVDMKVKAIYDSEIGNITRSEKNWKDVLKVAGQLYRYEFDNIVMVTAQRPPEKSTLMADYDTWKKVGRYVKRGAKGCAIFPSRALNPRMRYIFDISDTGGKNVKLTWDLEGENLKDYLDFLVSEGQIEQYDNSDRESLKNILKQFTGTDVWLIIKEEFGDRMTELMQLSGSVIKEESKKRNGLQQEMDMEQLVYASVMYAVGTRCGFDLSVQEQDFSQIVNIKDEEIIYRLGSIVCDVSCSVLREFSRNLKAIESERRIGYVRRNDLQGSGRTALSADRDAGRDGGSHEAGQIRKDGDELSKGERAGKIQDADEIREDVNENQKGILFEKLVKVFNGDLKGKTVALWGLAFKPGTDDMREAPALVLIEKLKQSGCNVRAYDPAAMDESRRRIGESVYYAHDMYDAALDADALILVTEWKEFRLPTWGVIKKAMKQPVVLDGRNIYDGDELQEMGFVYHCIGR